jgi:hypothetical protein
MTQIIYTKWNVPIISENPAEKREMFRFLEIPL